jgi:hypothetical protein
MLAGASPVLGQIIGIPKPKFPQYRNSIGFGTSVGPFIGRDAYFWGLAVDFGRNLTGPWSVAASFAFDRDIETPTEGGTKRVDALNAVGIVNYSVRSITLTTGLSKGFASTENPERSMRFASGDWGTGIVVGWTLPPLPWNVRDSIAVSVGYEYNLSQNEADISFDIGYAIAF